MYYCNTPIKYFIFNGMHVYYNVKTAELLYNYITLPYFQVCHLVTRSHELTIFVHHIHELTYGVIVHSH